MQPGSENSKRTAWISLAAAACKQCARADSEGAGLRLLLGGGGVAVQQGLPAVSLGHDVAQGQAVWVAWERLHHEQARLRMQASDAVNAPLSFVQSSIKSAHNTQSSLAMSNSPSSSQTAHTGSKSLLELLLTGGSLLPVDRARKKHIEEGSLMLLSMHTTQFIDLLAKKNGNIYCFTGSTPVDFQRQGRGQTSSPKNASREVRRG